MLAVCVALLGMLVAASGWAAQVVEVRVGRHPDFTRVVFELDRSAGYRIERSDPASKNAELIVSLDAGSIPRRIQSSKSFIEQVVVEPSGSRSVARIRLAKGGLALKEMILASPPRIVLDVLNDKPATASVAKSPSAPSKSGASAAASASKPAATVAKASPAPMPVSKPAPVVVKATPPSAPPVKPAASSPAPSTSIAAVRPNENPAAPIKVTNPGTTAPAPASRVLATNASGAPSAPATPPPAPSTVASTPTPTPSTSAAGSSPDTGRSDAPSTATAQTPPSAASPSPSAPDGSASAPIDSPDAVLAGNANGVDAPNGAAPDAVDHERPMMVRSTTGDAKQGSGLMTWALAGGALVAAFGALVIVRRRQAGASGFSADDADDAGEPADASGAATSPFATEDDEESEGTNEATSDSNPFSGLAGGAQGFAAAPPRGTPPPMRSAERPSDNQEQKPADSMIFDDAEETTMEGMEVISRSQVNELGGAMPMMGGAASDELTQMFREMQRRVAALEGRIDELVDARDRLERQVAAQTEELRVQRAAIARTQRAVRNLARPEEGGDDEPTEPALRDPN